MIDETGQSGASRRADYISGRESRREFPRRSTSLRDRNYSQSRDLVDRDSSRQGRGYSDIEDRQQNRLYSSGSYRQRTDYGAYRRSPESYYESRGRQYGREEGRGRYNRERNYDYDRQRGSQWSSREDYDEPYTRETLSGRYGYEQQYWPTRTRGDVDYRSDETDYGSYGRRDWTDTRYGRNYLRCSDIMTKDVTTCSRQASIREVAEKMQDDDVGSIPVVENGRLIGIVTDRDIVCRVLAEGLDTRTAMVTEAMSEDIVTCSPEENVVDAIRKMGEHQIRRIPVCDINGRLRGIISLGDIALEAERDQELAQSLEEISQPVPDRSRRV